MPKLKTILQAFMLQVLMVPDTGATATAGSPAAIQLGSIDEPKGTKTVTAASGGDTDFTRDIGRGRTQDPECTTTPAAYSGGSTALGPMRERAHHDADPFLIKGDGIKARNALDDDVGDTASQ
jgi:hypothetical protein